MATLMTEETMKLLVERCLFEHPDRRFLSIRRTRGVRNSKNRQREAKEGLDQMFKLAKNTKAKITIGSDYVDNAEQKKEQSYELTNREMVHACRDPQSGDSRQRQILYLSGHRNPYPGKLGVIERCAGRYSG